MGPVRLAIGILFIVSSILNMVVPIIMLGFLTLQAAGIIAGNILTAIAGGILLVALRKRGNIDWHFEFVVGIMLFVSSILQAIATGYEMLIARARVLDFAGALVYMTGALLVLILARRFGPLNLPRVEGLSFTLLFLVGAVLATVSNISILASYYEVWIRVFFFLGTAVALVASTLIQAVAMLILLYPYAKWKSEAS